MAMGIGASWMILLSLLMGGGTDLLDYVPSQDYWQAKGVVVTVDGLLQELAPPPKASDISKLLADLSSANAATRESAATQVQAMGPGVIPQLQEATKSDDPELAHRAKALIDAIKNGGKASSVRRLIAIRTLGEMKAKNALPRLRELTKSDAMFVGDYATAAIAAIDGKPYTRPHVDGSGDVWLLPEPCRLVGHLHTHGGQAIDFDAIMKQLPPDAMLAPPPGGAAAPAQTPTAIRKQVVDAVLGVAEKTGNMRLDGITLGVSGDTGANQGFGVVIAHGTYDAAAVAELVAGLQGEMKSEAKTIDATLVLSPNEHVSFFFPTNDRAVLTAGANQLPIEALVSAARTGKGKLAESKEMTALIGAVDVKQPIWGVVQMTPAFRQDSVLAPFDSIAVVGNQDAGNKLQIQFSGKGSDADKVKDAVKQMKQGIDQGLSQLKQLRQGMQIPQIEPMLKTVTTVLESIKCEANGKDATLSVSIPGDGFTKVLSSYIAMFRGMDIQPGAAPNGPAPNPPPALPQAPAPAGAR